jgi:hypothetical protein
MAKTIQEINEKIKSGKAVVYNAEEIIDIVNTPVLLLLISLLVLRHCLMMILAIKYILEDFLMVVDI